MAQRARPFSAGAACGFFAATALVILAWITAQPVSAKNTIVYQGVVTPYCDYSQKQTGGQVWKPTVNLNGGMTCSITFPTSIEGASVFVFGLNGATTPRSVNVLGAKMSFDVGPIEVGVRMAYGFSFLVIK